MENCQRKQWKHSCFLKQLQKLSFVLLMMSITTFVVAQGKNVSGVVLDSNREPIIGASITVDGTTKGTLTDLDGQFSIENIADNVQLKISYIGYVTRFIPVSGKSSFEIILENDTQSLDEIVVVGYGVQKKSDVTGAIASVTSKDIASRPVTNALQAMQGKLAGVDITSNERPGGIGSVRIRGVRSIGASNEPLYVVDGIPIMSASAIETLNPRDIEAIDVLKDASATAIYGSRGANGVIIVTTKKGKSGHFSLDYSSTVTIENIHDEAKMMNASEYITWRRWAAYNAGLISNPGDNPSIESDQIALSRTYGGDPVSWNNIMRGWADGSWDGSKVVNTDWTDYVSQTGLTHEHTVSASGGSEKIQGYASFGYMDNKGTIVGQRYKRYTGNISVDITPTKWFQMGGSINASWGNQDYGFTGSKSDSNLYTSAKSIFNYAQPYDEEGNLIQYPGGDDGMTTIMNEWDYNITKRQTFRAFGSFYAQLNLGEIHPALKGLKYRLNLGPDYRNNRSGQYIDVKSSRKLGSSYASLDNRRDFSWTVDNMITYDNRFGKHNVGVTLLQTASKWDIESSSMSGNGVERSDFLWNSFGSIDISNSANNVKINSGLTERQLESYMFRFNYGFNDRYLLTASGRWDGASQLAKGHKWAFFPSAALAWRMEQEKFIKDINWIEQLKLRVGVGATGNSAIDPYGTLGAIQSIYIPFGENTLGYTTNEPNFNGAGLQMANKTLGWEITTQYNFGLDFSVLRGRISGTIDAYISQTKDLLLEVKIPTLTGYPTTMANVGKTKNKGIDITLNTLNIQTNDFTWNTSTTFAYTKDKVVELANGKADDIPNALFIGKPISIYYRIDNDGLWQESDAEEMAKFNANGHEFKVGMVKPIDQNGDYKIDAEDRVNLGNRRPLFTFGMMNTFNYKNIELSFMLYGRFKYLVDTGGEAQLGRYNQRSLNYWTPDNTNADYQMPIYNEAGGDPYSSLLGFKKANFLKMRNISLGYIFPKKLIGKLGISNLKVYAQASNPFMVYSSIDFTDLDLGTSYYNKGFVFGIDVSF